MAVFSKSSSWDWPWHLGNGLDLLENHLEHLRIRCKSRVEDWVRAGHWEGLEVGGWKIRRGFTGGSSTTTQLSAFLANVDVGAEMSSHRPEAACKKIRFRRDDEGGLRNSVVHAIGTSLDSQ